MNMYQGDVEDTLATPTYHENVSGSPSGPQTTSSKVLGWDTSRTTLAAGFVETMTGGRVRISTWPSVRFVVPKLSVSFMVTVKFPALTLVWVICPPTEVLRSPK